MNPGTITISPVLYTPGQPAWIFLVFLGMLILISWIQITNFSRFLLMINANFNSRSLHHLTRDANPFRERITIALSLNYVIALSLLIYQFLTGILELELPIHGFRLYLLICLLVTGFWVLKLFLMNFLTMVFRTDNTNDAYLLNILLSNSLIGILLLPILVFAIYLNSEWLTILAIAIVLLLAAIRLFKGFIIGLSLKRFSYFFLFVYLCTLELMPLLLMYKVLFNNSFNG